MILRGKYIAPVDGPILENGWVEIRGGFIADTGAWRAGCAPGRDVTDLGEVLLLPGFVNAHTHLELSRLAGEVPPGPELIDWLEGVVTRTISPPPDDEAVRAAVRAGVAQSLAAGVSTVGDITRHPQVVRPVLARSALGGVSFGEVVAIGRRRGLLEARLSAAVGGGAPSSGAGSEAAPTEPHTFVVGVSPHAPYTVEPDGLRRCAQCAAAAGLPLTIHLLESPHEEEFTREGTGPLRDYLMRLGVWDDGVPAGGADPIEVCDRAGVLGPRTIAAHVNYVTDAQIARLAATGTHVAYCPRTHAAFGHPPHRYRDMLAAGINVCCGTDSLASNPSLSMLDELRFIHARGDGLPPAGLLRLGTLAGAAALGMRSRAGSITAGKWANLTAVPLAGQGPRDPLENVLESGHAPCWVMSGGVIRVGGGDSDHSR